MTKLIIPPMKTFCALFVIALLYANPCTADDSYSEVPLSAEDLKNILELNVNKFQIDFKKSGYPTLEIKGIDNPITVILPYPSKSATIVTYLERAPYSVKPGTRQLDTLHYWFSNEGGGQHSYFQFYADKANRTTTGLKKGIYTVVATKSKDAKDEIGYTLRITSASKRKTSESTEQPTRPKPNSK